MIKYLINKKGFRKSHQKGSHVSLHNSDTKKYTSIPSKNEKMGTGLIKQILDDCDITRDEFIHDYQMRLIK